MSEPVKEKSITTWKIWAIRGCIGALVLGFGITVYLSFDRPYWAVGKSYVFSYSIKTSIPIGGNSVESRMFIMTDGYNFSSPVAGPMGEKVLILDQDLPVNTFRLVSARSPELTIGPVIFQPTYNYTEVHYNIGRTNEQVVVPLMKPTNAPPPSK